MADLNVNRNQGNGGCKIRLFCVNDVHGNFRSYGRLTTAKDTFERQGAQKGRKTLSFNAGDFFYGTCEKLRNLGVSVMNRLNFTASTIGNHECDMSKEDLAQTVERVNSPIISTNMDTGAVEKTSDDTSVKGAKRKSIVRSQEFMQDGHRFMIMGLAPREAGVDGVSDKIEDSIQDVNAVIDEARQSGINKIIVVSHMGHEDNEKIAENCAGVDVIVGGHTHQHLNADGIVDSASEATGTQVVRNKKDGAPVLITEAGKDGHHAVGLDLDFDENGVIKLNSVESHVIEVDKAEESSDVKKLAAENLGEEVTLATVKNGYTAPDEWHERYQENPVVNLACDSVLEAGEDQGVEAVLMSTKSIKKGVGDKITSYNIEFDGLMPYNSKFKVVNLTEKELVDLMNSSSESVFDGHTVDPDLLRTAGLKVKYEPNAVGDRKPVKSLVLTDKDGKTVREIDVNNPSDKKVKIAVEESCAKFLGSKEAKGILAPHIQSAPVLGKQQDMMRDYLAKHKELDLSMPQGEDRRLSFGDTDSSMICSNEQYGKQKA